jgi:threonine/homoserine/homoserine lactone efflux protein
MHTDEHRFLSWFYPRQSVSIRGWVSTIRTTLTVIVNHVVICHGVGLRLHSFMGDLVMGFEAPAIFAASFVLALSGALVPGPLFTITIAESVRCGFRAGPLLITGHALLELLLVIAVIQGLGAYLKLSLVTGVIALLGGLLLVYFGIDMVRTAGNLSLVMNVEKNPEQASHHPIVMGMIASLVNPYWVLWWATVGLGYLVSVMKFGTVGVAVFFLGHIAGDYAWYSLVSLGVSKGRSFLKDSGYRVLVRACGVFLCCFGAWFLYSAKTSLMNGSL